MTFNLISLGLNKNSISAEALDLLKSCDKVYLENYTVNFPYSIKELEKSLKIKILELDRAKVEDESILKEAKEANVALLIYGDALSATTHTQLALEAKKQNIETNTFHNASIMTVIAETGLQPYKFGKTASMPNWEEHTNKPTSFMNYVKENQSIKAHTLILTDIGLEMKSAMIQLLESSEKTDIKIPEKIIALSSAGTPEQKIFYDTPNSLKDKKIPMPFCLIIPTELHFVEEETLKEMIK
jgi:diphthine synthase